MTHQELIAERDRLIGLLKFASWPQSERQQIISELNEIRKQLAA